jgi:hypothetical protein
MSFISPLKSLCVLCAIWKKILFFIYFLDAALQGLLGDHPFGLLILKPGVLFLYPARLKASSLHMLSLAFHNDVHLFQIFVSILCDRLWFCRNKAMHDGIIPDITILALSIKKTTLAHAAA